MIHSLKLDTKWFDAVAEGFKRFEIRYNDRDYHVGDRLVLQEIEHGPDGKMDCTGRLIVAQVVFMLTAEEFPQGLKEGYVILSIVVEDVSE